MRMILAAISVCLLLAAEPKPEASKEEMKRLQGEWSMVAGERDGQKLPEDTIEGSKRVAKGDITTVTLGGRLFMKARFTVDPSRNPKAIDYTLLEGASKGKKQLGIYEVKGNLVRFCFASVGGPRPKDFTAKKGSGRTASAWKRVKN